MNEERKQAKQKADKAIAYLQVLTMKDPSDQGLEAVFNLYNYISELEHVDNNERATMWQLMEEKARLEKQVAKLKEYKAMYEALCK